MVVVVDYDPFQSCEHKCQYVLNGATTVFTPPAARIKWVILNTKINMLSVMAICEEGGLAYKSDFIYAEHAIDEFSGMLGIPFGQIQVKHHMVKTWSTHNKHKQLPTRR